MDVLTKQQRHKNMSHIRCSDTKGELLLRNALWHKGIRYRKNYKVLPGKPDIAITRYRIAIFVDGDFWHGREFEKIKNRLDTNKEFWIKKIETNKKRDIEVNNSLSEMGWVVLRFWESDISKKLDNCIEEILKYFPYTINMHKMSN